MECVRYDNCIQYITKKFDEMPDNLYWEQEWAIRDICGNKDRRQCNCARSGRCQTGHVSRLIQYTDGQLFAYMKDIHLAHEVWYNCGYLHADREHVAWWISFGRDFEEGDGRDDTNIVDIVQKFRECPYIARMIKLVKFGTPGSIVRIDDIVLPGQEPRKAPNEK